MIWCGALRNVTWVAVGWSRAGGDPARREAKRREALGQACAPWMRTSVSEARHCLSARVSIFVPGWKWNWILVMRLGLAPGSPGSLHVMKVSMPPEAPACVGRYVSSNVEPNCGLGYATAAERQPRTEDQQGGALDVRPLPRVRATCLWCGVPASQSRSYEAVSSLGGHAVDPVAAVVRPDRVPRPLGSVT